MAFNQNNEYDKGVNTFSKEGRIFQIEYAQNAVKKGASSVGIVCKGGIVLAAERKGASELMEIPLFEKIAEIDSHIICAVSGLVPDSRTLVDFARGESQSHRFTYNEPIGVYALAQAVSDIALNFGEGDITTKRKPIARPYGVALLMGGIDEEGSKLYQVDPAGNMIGYSAKGIGEAESNIDDILMRNFNKEMGLEDAEKLALSCLKQSMQKKIAKNLVILSSIPLNTRQMVKRDEDYIEKLMENLPDVD